MSSPRSRLTQEIIQTLLNSDSIFLLTEGRVYSTEAVLLRDEPTPLITIRWLQGSIGDTAAVSRVWPLQIQVYSSESFDQVHEIHEHIVEALHRKRLAPTQGPYAVPRCVSDATENYDHETGDFIAISLWRVNIIKTN